MKDILISIKPRWAEDILAGRKFAELRRTMPKMQLYPNFPYTYVGVNASIYICNGGKIHGAARVYAFEWLNQINPQSPVCREHIERLQRCACVTQEEWEGRTSQSMCGG